MKFSTDHAQHPQRKNTLSVQLINITSLSLINQSQEEGRTYDINTVNNGGGETDPCRHGQPSYLRSNIEGLP